MPDVTMTDVKARILEALTMAGLGASDIAAVRAGTPIYGDEGVVDSLGLVRVVSAVSTGFEDRGVDMFDLLLECDLDAAAAFSTLPAIEAFIGQALADRAPESRGAA